MKESRIAPDKIQLITGKNIVTSLIPLNGIVFISDTFCSVCSFCHCPSCSKSSNNLQYVYVYLTRTSSGRVNGAVCLFSTRTKGRR